MLLFAMTTQLINLLFPSQTVMSTSVTKYHTELIFQLCHYVQRSK